MHAKPASGVATMLPIILVMSTCVVVAGTMIDARGCPIMLISGA